MARPTKNTDTRTEVCRSTRAGELSYMQQRLAYLGCTDIRVDKGSMRRDGKYLRTFILTVPATQYDNCFPRLEQGSTAKNRGEGCLEEVDSPFDPL